MENQERKTLLEKRRKKPAPFYKLISAVGPNEAETKQSIAAAPVGKMQELDAQLEEALNILTDLVATTVSVDKAK